MGDILLLGHLCKSPRAKLSRAADTCIVRVAMKIYSLAILHPSAGKESQVLASASDLSSFSFFQRGGVQEFMTFFSKTVSDRTAPGQRQSVQEQSYIAHVYNKGGSDPLVGA